MSIHVALQHITHYRYDRPIKLGPQVVRLRPAPHCRSRVLAYSLKVEPENHFINWQQDPFANYQARLVFPEVVREFKVTVDLVAEMAVYSPFDFFLEPSAEKFPFRYEPHVAQELAPYLVTEPMTPLLQSYWDSVDRSACSTIDFLVRLNQQVHQDIRYLIRMEPGVQTPEETLAYKSGSCRDSAWLMVQLLRHCGLAARFVSGYLIQLTPDVKSLDGPSGTETDFTDLHAWCEVYLPGAGWIGLDATSGLLAGEGHLPLACTPQPSSAAPIEGVLDFAEVEFSHHMQVTRVYESPRVTKPYTEAQWAQILALGDAVERDLQTHDVRLTMGGEPTFVAIENRDAAEWNTAALGPTKRDYALPLTYKLRDHYGRGGFLHFGQGKWYPGEPLPRWAMNIYWRADGQVAWRNPDLFADERETYNYTVEDAQRFISLLAGELGLPDHTIAAGYEDVGYYLWREGHLPNNVDPFDERLNDAQERDQLRRVLGRSLGAVVGYVLPLQARTASHAHRWQTAPWHFRNDRLVLAKGDSPMGLRLPLDSLPWLEPEERRYVIDRDPHALTEALPDDEDLRRRLDKPASLDPMPKNSPVRTALCVQVRSPANMIYIFMPPLERLEDYLTLVAAVETTAQTLGVRIVLEGYPPPRDPRLRLLQVTPDPGVIEVNIHPAHDWRELVAHTEFLYQTAFESRLSAEKFMTDGRHTGTGGGNHFVMGGATPDDSPFLRKPELLTSLLLYWQNHPSLSYLFSGLFIGPTSQAPRVDEARSDQLYELEIAVQEIYRYRQLHGKAMPPWTVDRTLRNLLIDVTGNTHRSEFSIDKLFSPDSATGRLGLLELRAFEMPPHARMSVVQQLFLRACIARFWQQPYQAGAVRWGTTLHDRFMLPTFIRQDFEEVLQDMARAGYVFDPQWFAPHFEFRFPRLGQVQTNGVTLTLRTALEPWYVMGEQASQGGTARYVDSSLERLEVQVTGFNPDRYVVTVNGRAVPLQTTGVAGQFAAGVRYRAWAPPSALHPTIGVHVPLTFDIVDTWNQRSLGGCQYHVAHPGGRNYETLPVNAYEAESRRLSRFSELGHSSGQIDLVARAINAPASAEFPCTLDLRRI